MEKLSKGKLLRNDSTRLVLLKNLLANKNDNDYHNHFYNLVKIYQS